MELCAASTPTQRAVSFNQSQVCITESCQNFIPSRGRRQNSHWPNCEQEEDWGCAPHNAAVTQLAFQCSIQCSLSVCQGRSDAHRSLLRGCLYRVASCHLHLHHKKINPQENKHGAIPIPAIGHAVGDVLCYITE